MFLSLLVIGIRVACLAIKFVLSLFLARFMGFADLGLYGLVAGAAIVAPVLIGFGVNQKLIRDVVDQPLAVVTRSLAFYTLWVCGVYFSLLILVIMLIPDGSERKLSAILIVFVIFLENLSGDIYHLLLNRSLAVSANVLLFVRSGFWMTAFMWAAYELPYLRTMEVMFGFWLFGSLLGFVFFVVVARDWPWKGLSNLSEGFAALWREVGLGKALYFSSLATTISSYIDRYLVTAFLGIELAGVYIFYWTIYSALFNLIYTGVIQFSRPKLVLAFKDRSRSYYSLYVGCMKSTAGVSVLMTMAAGTVIYYLVPLLDKPLAVEWLSILWIILAGTVLGSLREAQLLVFYSQRRDDLTLKCTSIMLISALVLNLTLIPAFSLWGAALAFLLTNAVIILAQRHFSRNLVRWCR